MKIDIIHEDNDLIVVNKPSNLLSVPDRWEDKPNIKSMLEQKSQAAFTVHRLDKGTSGIILFAKNAEAHKSLSLQFQNRTVGKYYLALVEGIPVYEEGQIDVPIASAGKGTVRIDASGKPSTTLFRILERWQNHALLELKLLTGRLHQARIHLTYLNCPLMVDADYGRNTEFYLSEIKRNYRPNRTNVERPLLSRTPLHAYKLEFTHPTSKEKCSFESDPPKDMKATINQLNRWSS